MPEWYDELSVADKAARELRLTQRAMRLERKRVLNRRAGKGIVGYRTELRPRAYRATVRP